MHSEMLRYDLRYRTLMCCYDVPYFQIDAMPYHIILMTARPTHGLIQPENVTCRRAAVTFSA